tara:strand:- start:229 stop:423 length:195 start_codon:yes stop_codon:yes gene_type:complete
MKYQQKHPEFPLDSAWNDPDKIKYFVDEVSDLAFGDDTIQRGFTMEEVITRIKLYCYRSINEYD